MKVTLTIAVLATSLALVLAVKKDLKAGVGTNEADSGKTGHYFFFMPLLAKSSVITLVPVVKKLLERGHSVTTAMPFTIGEDPTHPNLRILPTSDYFEKWTEEMSKYYFNDEKDDWWAKLSLPIKTLNVLTAATEHCLAHKAVKRFLETANVDVLVSSGGNEVAFYLAHRFNASLVSYQGQQGAIHSQDFALGQPFSPATQPFIFFSFKHPMTFMQRVINSLTALGLQLFKKLFVISATETLLDKHFPDSVGKRPHFNDLETRVSVGFHFGHPLIMDGNRPTAPNFVYLGMMNCREPEPIEDKRLKEFMESTAAAENGVILVSFGTVLRSSSMSNENKEMFLKVFGRLKQQVLWKWETEEMEGKPDNLMLYKWLPQQDILGHPNLKVFVTHGGQSSTQEAWCHKKPTVIAPIFFDQFANGAESELHGCGISIPFSKLTSDNLFEAIDKILTNVSYTDNAIRRGNLLMDQMNQPLERAIWWLEYSLRNPGQLFRPTVHDLSWYQLWQLDVWAFVLMVILVPLVSIAFMCKLCWRFARSKVKKD